MSIQPFPCLALAQLRVNLLIISRQSNCYECHYSDARLSEYAALGMWGEGEWDQQCLYWYDSSCRVTVSEKGQEFLKGKI